MKRILHTPQATSAIPPTSNRKSNGKQYQLFLCLIFIYIAGIVFGIQLILHSMLQSYGILWAEIYLNSFLTLSSPIKLFAYHFSLQLLVMLITMFLAFSAFGLPLLLAELFGRGFLFGAVCTYCAAYQKRIPGFFTSWFSHFLCYEIGKSATLFIAVLLSLPVSLYVSRLAFKAKNSIFSVHKYFDKWLLLCCFSILWCALCCLSDLVFF